PGRIYFVGLLHRFFNALLFLLSGRPSNQGTSVKNSDTERSGRLYLRVTRWWSDHTRVEGPSVDSSMLRSRASAKLKPPVRLDQAFRIPGALLKRSSSSLDPFLN